jgi:thiol-disulfide isomerase/thioredoxin
MKTITLALACCTLVGSAALAATGDKPVVATGTEIGQRLPHFTAQATDGSAAKPKAMDFDSSKVKRPTVYIFVGTACPATAAYAERLVQLEKTYRKKVDFIYLYPNRDDAHDEQLTFHHQKKFTGRVIDDHGGRLAHLFNAQRTSELFLVNKDGVIVYHGAVDDSRDPRAVKRHYLATALDELLGGKPITIASSQVFA